MIGVKELSLFKKAKLNKTKTAQKVNDFFTEDFNHYLNLANKHLSDISSPKLDATGVTTHDGKNHQDESLAINLDAQACVAAVDHALSSCDYKHGKILYQYFIQGLTDEKIYQQLNYQSSRYYEIKTDALVEFAERMDYWRQHEHSSIEDLRVFEDVELTE